MNKVLHKNDTQVTPFITTKDWELSNITNDGLIVMEHSGSDGLPIALEYLNYTPNAALTASGCNIALENQDIDLVILRDGLKTEGIFYPDIDPQNSDGTYQRMIYAQIATMFYNNYRDPTKLWGIEQIDLEKSQTKKFISDKFKLFNIPQPTFGEKIVENSVILLDTTSDNDYIIQDDGNCNLFAGTNLFSRQQEIGEYSNNLESGSIGGCDDYNSISIPDAPILLIFFNACNTTNILSWDVNFLPVINYFLFKSTDGINYMPLETLTGNFNMFADNNISIGKTYWYKMYASNILGTSSISTTVSSSVTNVTWNVDSDVWSLNKNCGPINWNGNTTTSIVWDSYSSNWDMNLAYWDGEI